MSPRKGVRPMTTPHTAVDIEGMKLAQPNFQNAVDQINTAYTAMESQQEELAASWTGETSTAFGQALAQWLSDFGVVRTQLQRILELLSTNTGIYANVNEEATNEAMKTGKFQGLPGF